MRTPRGCHSEWARLNSFVPNVWLCAVLIDQNCLVEPQKHLTFNDHINEDNLAVQQFMSISGAPHLIFQDYLKTAPHI